MAAEPRPKGGASAVGPLAIAAGVIAADQLAKLFVAARMQPGETVPLLEGLFQIRFIVNRGGLFGVFRDLPDLWRTVLFTGVPLIASVGLLLFLLRTPAAQIHLRSGLALILGGAVGNLADRLRLGYVVDYLDVFFREHHWPAFNVADSAICIGVGLILLDALRPAGREGMPNAEPATERPGENAETQT